MENAEVGFDPLELLFFFQPPVIGLFLAVAMVAVLVRYSRGTLGLVVVAVLTWPLLVALDFLFYGYPRQWQGEAFLPGLLARTTAVLVPLVLITAATWLAARLRLPRGVAAGAVSSLAVAFASPIYVLWLLTVGCLLTGDCL